MSFSASSIVDAGLHELVRRLQPLDQPQRNLLLQGWSEQLGLATGSSWDQIVYEIRRRATFAAADHEQLVRLMNELIGGLQMGPILTSSASTPRLPGALTPVSGAQNTASATAMVSSTSSAALGLDARGGSAQISGLIQKLKTGEITQAQLYAQLTTIYAGNHKLGKVAVVGDANAVTTPASVSSSARRSLMESMNATPLSKITLATAPENSAKTMQPTKQAEQTGESIESSLADGVSEDRTAEELADDAALASEIQLLQAEIARTQTDFVSGKASSSDGDKVQPRRPATAAQQKSSTPTALSRSNVTRPTSARQQSSSPLPARCVQWQEKVRSRASALKVEKDQSEQAVCSFHPELNPRSKEMTSGAAQGYQRFFSRSRVRAKLTEDEIVRAREDEVRDACTFRPEINPTSSRLVSNAVQRSQLFDGAGNEAIRITTHRSNAAEDAVAECTFQPRTNTVKSSMVTAAQYLVKDPFERLYQGIPTSEDTMAAFYGSPPASSGLKLAHNPSTRAHGSASSANLMQKSASSLQLGPRSLFRSNSADSFSNLPQDAKPKIDHDVFHARQEAFEQQRKSHLQRIRQFSDDEMGQPALNRRSLHLAQQRNPNDFLTRLQQNIERAQQNKIGITEMVLEDAECTFVPQITNKAKQRQSRTWQDMQKGDSEKRETKLKILTMAEEERELDGVTFKPVTNRNKNAESRLRCLKEPDSYLQRLQEQRDKLDEKNRIFKQDEQDKLLAECTFTPRTTEVPAFVKRMAASTRLDKSAMGYAGYGTPRPALPDRSWR